jgi:hypothetical protein
LEALIEDSRGRIEAGEAQLADLEDAWNQVYSEIYGAK